MTKSVKKKASLSDYLPYGADDIDKEENDIGGGHCPQGYGDACQHLGGSTSSQML